MVSFVLSSRSSQLCVGFPGLPGGRKEDGLVSQVFLEGGKRPGGLVSQVFLIVPPAVSRGQLCPVQQVFPDLPGGRKEAGWSGVPGLPGGRKEGLVTCPVLWFR